MFQELAEVYRVRVTPEVGYWEQCGLLVLTPPKGGFCQVFQHPRRDLSRAKAEELQERIREVGKFRPGLWEHKGQIEADKVL